MVVHALRAYKKGAEYSAPFLGTISKLKGFYFVELEIYPLSKNSPQFTTPVAAGQAGRLRRLACLSLASRSLSAMA